MATTLPTLRDIIGRNRTIVVERKMRGGALVIVDIRGWDAAQMALVEDLSQPYRFNGSSLRLAEFD
jgi:hypothetical protein